MEMNFIHTRKEINNFNKECIYQYDLILKILVQFLNSVHSKNENINYWERIIGPWLLDAVQVVLFNDKKVKDLIKNGIRNIKILDENDFHFTSKYFEFFNYLRFNQLFHDQIFSSCISYCYQSEFNIERYRKSFVKEKIEQPINDGGLKNKLAKVFRHIISLDINSEVVLNNSVFSVKHMVALFFKSFFKIRVIDFGEIDFKFKKSYSKRSTIRKFSTNDSDIDMLMYLCVEILMPTYFLEGYNKILSYAESKIDYNNVPKKIFTDYGFFQNTTFSLWASECGKLGSKIISIQHGGGYGEFEHKTRYLEENLVDEFCTWGWKENKKHFPVVSPILKKIPLNKKNRDDKILWVTTSDSNLDFRIENGPQGFLLSKYFEHQKNLYAEIDKQIRKKIVIRIDDREKFEIEHEARFKKIDENITLSGYDSNLINHIKSSKLVICDYFGSTIFLQSLYLNIPTIIIGHKDLFSIKESSKKYFKSMIKAGIYFTDHKEGGDFINSNFDQIDAWWNENKRKRTLELFKKNFLYNNDLDFIDSWKNYFLL